MPTKHLKADLDLLPRGGVRHSHAHGMRSLVILRARTLRWACRTVEDHIDILEPRLVVSLGRGKLERHRIRILRTGHGDTHEVRADVHAVSVIEIQGATAIWPRIHAQLEIALRCELSRLHHRLMRNNRSSFHEYRQLADLRIHLYV